MRLHSCYFSKQNLETTVVNQGMLKMLFKGILPLGNLKINISTPDYMQPFSKCQIQRVPEASNLGTGFTSSALP